MAENEKAYVLDKSYANQTEYLTFPGVPGRYLGSQPVPLSQLGGITAEEMKARIKESGLPLKETTGALLGTEQLYGVDTRFETESEPTTPREAGWYPGLNIAESEARDAVKKQREKLPPGVTPADLPRGAEDDGQNPPKAAN